MIIEVAGLCFTYPGNREQTLKEINFGVEKGEIFGFLGPSGAGKSTLQKILIGVLKKYSGRVAVMGQEIKSVTAGYYEKVGVAFEFPNLYTRFTALENLAFFRSLYNGETEDPRRLLAMVGLEEEAGVRVAAFSKGMKVRLNFCRAFLNKPEILFLDEPTAGLDPVNTKRIKDIILEYKAKGNTVLLTTHNMQVAGELCDRVAFLVDGEVKTIDSPRQLKLRGGKKTVRVEYRDNGAVHTRDFSLVNIGCNPGFLELLARKDIETIHTQEATLEDIFISVTGRSLS